MTEQWKELKEAITEMRDNDGTGTQYEVCKFLANLMDVLEKQMNSSEKPNSCDDTVSCEAVIEWLKAKDIIKLSSQADTARKELKALPSVNPQVKMGHWIPVSERWPEENGYYLITTVYHEVYCDYWGEDCFDRTETVIAWMPLPKPYGLQKGKDINVGNQT